MAARGARAAAAAACLAAAAAGRAADPAGPDVLDVEPVWSGHPVGFCLLTRPPHQFVAYYDAERRMTVAQRRLEERAWRFTKLDTSVGWDSHNGITMVFDRDGILHLAGNMHCVPLIYFRATRPMDAASLTRVPAMTGDREKKVTYPVFFTDPAGRLVFRYRDGSSGSGDDLYNVYAEATRTWSRLLDQPLLSGLGRMNAYASRPEMGPDGRYHIIWVWRDTPDCATNHDLGYARSEDLVRWTDSAGRPLVLPITLETAETVDPVPPGGGLLNGNAKLGFDSGGRPVITYHKYDAAGDLQIYAARRETDGWAITQISDWTGYRWEFSGGGTIIGEVSVGTVQPAGPGRLALAYRYGKGSGMWILDEATLKPIPGAKPPPRPPGVPGKYMKLESTFAGMQKRRTADSGQPPPGVDFALVWEVLPANRDRPRPPPHPEPSMLRVVRIVVPETGR